MKDKTTGQLVNLMHSHLNGAVNTDVITDDMMAWDVADEELFDRKEVGAGAFGVVLSAKWRGTVKGVCRLTPPSC